MKNSEYWQDRFIRMEQAQHKVSKTTLQEVDRQYRKAQKEIESRIDRWYRRLAKNNSISYKDATEYIKGADLEEFRWDVQEYIAHGRENAVNKAWMKELENASAKYHITKLEALKIQIQDSLEELHASQEHTVYDSVSDAYKTSYYHSAYEIQKGVGIGWDIAGIDEDKLSKILVKPWAPDGHNFSERIWGNCRKLVNELHKEITRSVILGEDPQKAINNISAKFGVSKSRAGALVMTENAYFGSEGQKDCFNDLDVEEYEVVATLDTKTSEICQDMDGKVFKMSDYKSGETAPPFHVRCRTTTAPYFEDMKDISERFARGPDGKTYKVPGNVKYKDWKECYVDHTKKPEDLLKEAQKDDIIKAKKEISEPAKEIIDMLKASGVESRPVSRLPKELTTQEITERLAGGDMTKGSCSSLAFAYAGNRNGFDVLDFRGGSSQHAFSRKDIIRKIAELPDIRSSITNVKREIQGTMEVLKGLEMNKEYYLAVGKHAAVVRRLETGFEYLELQSATENGWIAFDNRRYGSMFGTLSERFGCRKTVDRSYGHVWEKQVILIDVDSLHDNYDFEQLLSYINTQADKQRKGEYGTIR